MGLDAPVGGGSGWRRRGLASPGARTMRCVGADSSSRKNRIAKCVGRHGHHFVRGFTPAETRLSTRNETWPCWVSFKRVRGLEGLDGGFQMFCPKCATQNIDGASFCRACGANISLIPQALSGQLPQAREDEEIEIGRRGRRRHRSEASIDHAIKKVFMGIAFIVVSIALAFSR